MDNIIKEIQNKATSHAKQGELKQAFLTLNKFFKDYTLDNSKLANDWIVIFNEFSDLRSREIKGTISFEEINVSKNSLMLFQSIKYFW